MKQLRNLSFLPANVTDGLTLNDVESLGFTRFEDVRSTLSVAMTLRPGDSVKILPAGGYALPALNEG